jgi:hypothetical protein
MRINNNYVVINVFSGIMAVQSHTGTSHMKNQEKIETFDKNNLKDLRHEIDLALAAVTEKFGVALSIGSISYSPNGTATTRLTMTAVGHANVSDLASAIAKKEWDQYAPSWGLKKEDLGKTIKLGRIEYLIVGIKPRARKTPILGKNLLNNQVYKLPITEVLDAVKLKNVS